MSKTEIQRKMQAIETAVLSILIKTPQGISLAQLPLYLKRALKFPLNIAELGFAKLKDLLLTFPRVAVELRGTNHPFAVLKDPKTEEQDYNPSPDQILNSIYQIFRENKFGISEGKLEPQLAQKIGRRVDWSVYQTTSLVDFIQIFASNQFEILKTRDTNMIFKIENPSYNYFYSPFRDNLSSADYNRTPPRAHQTSYSLDFPETPSRMQKVVNVSNIPLDFTTKEDSTESTFHYLDNFYDISTDMSSGFNSLSIDSNFKSGTLGIWDKKPHIRTHSEGLSETSETKRVPQHQSWIGTSGISPPPGFE